MNVKLFSVTVITALLSIVIVACEPTDKNENPSDNIPPLLDEWWKQIESGGETLGDLRYKIEDGEIKIIRYEGEGGIVTIPAEIEELSVTSIGIHAFRETKLTDVVIPDSVISIGNNAFRYNQLASVIIPDSVTFIGESAFYRNQLTSVIIPDSVTSIGESAFYRNQLASVIIPDSVTSIGNNAFRDNQLADVIIPDSVTSIEGGTFAGNQLASVIIPDSVTFIGESAFYGNLLTSVVIPDSVISIERWAFSGKRHANLVIPEGGPDFSSDWFTGSSLVEITIGVNVSLNRDAIGGVLIDGSYIPSGFVETYSNNGRLAGTYTRPDTDSNDWTRQ